MIMTLPTGLREYSKMDIRRGSVAAPDPDEGWSGSVHVEIDPTESFDDTMSSCSS